MDSRRQEKIASVIQEVFTDILTKHGRDFYGSAFVTVTQVKVTSDLTLARFYLSIFNTTDKNSVLAQIEEKKFEIKRMLGEKLRFQLRRIPEIEFFLDDTLDHAYKIDELFKQIEEDRKKLDEENN
jgi:ribosome-binding factor A